MLYVKYRFFDIGGNSFIGPEKELKNAGIGWNGGMTLPGVDFYYGRLVTTPSPTLYDKFQMSHSLVWPKRAVDDMTFAFINSGGPKNSPNPISEHKRIEYDFKRRSAEKPGAAVLWGAEHAKIIAAEDTLDGWLEQVYLLKVQVLDAIDSVGEDGNHVQIDNAIQQLDSDLLVLGPRP